MTNWIDDMQELKKEAMRDFHNYPTTAANLQFWLEKYIYRAALAERKRLASKVCSAHQEPIVDCRICFPSYSDGYEVGVIAERKRCAEIARKKEVAPTQEAIEAKEDIATAIEEGGNV